jgi:mannose-1-phosphate guanylyltransferase
MRNTAPCIAYGCHKIHKINPNACVVIAPSDHLIMDTEGFVKAINHSIEIASKHDCLITLGIKPSRPDTGYGYIQFNSETLEGDFFKVKTFTEKPTIELAKTFIQSGEFLWNAGIFVWSTKNIVKAFSQYLPEINDVFKEGEAVFNTKEEQNFIKKAYYQCTNISIDYGIMEKADNVYVLPSEFGWSDLGTWASVYELAEKDYVGNAVIPSEKVIMYDSSNCMVKVPTGKLVILQGLHDFIVVENNNTLLICPRDEEQNIEQVVNEVKQRFGTEFI